MLADEIVGRAAVEDGDRVVVAVDECRADAGGARNFVGAVDAEDFFDEIDRAVEIAAVARNVDGPLGRAVGKFTLADDGEVERFQRLAHGVVGNIEAEALADERGRDLDFALPRTVAADPD